MGRKILFTGMAALAVSSGLAAQDSGEDAAGHWAAIARCGAIEGAAARHRCTDEVLRNAGVLTPERVAEESREAFGRNPQREAPVQAAAPRAAAAEVLPAEEEEDELLTTIKSVRNVGYRSVQVTTAEGSVWNQTQAKTFTAEPKVGDAFSVRRAALGSYRCRFGSASRYRCERVD